MIVRLARRAKGAMFNPTDDVPRQVVVLKVGDEALSSGILRTQDRAEYRFYLAKTQFQSMDITFGWSALETWT